MDTKELLKSLCALYARSGFESEAAGEIVKILAPYCSETYVTVTGSAVGIRHCGIQGAPLIMLDGHLDQIGYTVSAVEDGFIRLAPGFNRTPLPGKELMVWGREPLYGIVAVMPPHLQKETGKIDDYEHFAVDIGYPLERARQLVSPGDPVTFPAEFIELASGRVSSPAIDDRAALAAIIGALDDLAKSELRADLAIVASSGEEVGGSGALGAAYQLKPDFAIVLDVTFAAQKGFDDPDVMPEDCGVAITRGPHMNRRLTERLFAIAGERGIPHRAEVEPSATGTNATHVRIAGGGVATALLGIPMRYMHSPTETVNIANIDAARRLLYEYLISFRGGGESD